MATAATKPHLDELVINAPGTASRRIVLDHERYRLGRSPTNELAFPADPKLSREHLVFERSAEGWTVRDLGSSNGTQVNGVRLTTTTRLNQGDRITAGHLVIGYDTRGELGCAQLHEITFVEPEVARAQPAVSVNLQAALEPSPGAAGGPTLDSAHWQALVRAGRELAGHGTLDQLFELVLDLSLETVKAARGVVMTADHTGELRVRAVRGEGFRISTAVRDLVIQQARSLLVRDALLDQDFAAQQSILTQEIRSILAVPLQTEERVLGLLYLDSPHLIHEFTPEDLNLVTVIANIAAIRIEHARLVENEQTRKLLEQDLERAAEIQRRLLPSQAPKMRGWEMAGYNAPCRTVGGDYYDFLPYPDGRVAVLIGDVSGKGLGAALLMSSLQARVQVIFETPERLADKVGHLNRSLAAHCPANCFITFFLAVLDPAHHEIQYCNAGQNAPLLLRRNGEVESLEATGIPLGISRHTSYEQKSCHFEDSDLLVLFSDGVTEACRPDRDEEFGEDGLLATLGKGRTRSVVSMLEEVQADLRSFTGGTAATDDVTLVIARRVGSVEEI
jgi:serine phosphatase RsbU (regulator of sigma subunit)